jgi:hypothetical protein
MLANKKFLVLFILFILVIPFSASAGWFWNKPAVKNTKQAAATVTPTELSAGEKSFADAKYKLWDESFEKRNIEATIKNKDNFWFTISEINYLFNIESAKVKKPLMNNLTLAENNGFLNISADFNKIIKGHVSFSAQIGQNKNRLRLNLSRVRILDLPVPAYPIAKSFNNGFDEYFSFIYRDHRYQGFEFSNNNGVLKFNLKFK